MIATFSGVLLDPGNLRLEDVNLVDIAHHLTNENRYGGALPFDLHYSVAEHCILMAQYALDYYDNPGVAKVALLHDASEYILRDMTTGVKGYLPDYKRLENKVQTLIYEKYGCLQVFSEIVSAIDKRIVLNEVLVLTPQHYRHHDKSALSPLNIEHLAVNDDDYGRYTPGTVPKQVVYEEFLRMCALLHIED